MLSKRADSLREMELKEDVCLSEDVNTEVPPLVRRFDKDVHGKGKKSLKQDLDR